MDVFRYAICLSYFPLACWLGKSSEESQLSWSDIGKSVGRLNSFIKSFFHRKLYSTGSTLGDRFNLPNWSILIYLAENKWCSGRMIIKFSRTRGSAFRGNSSTKWKPQIRKGLGSFQLELAFPRTIMKWIWSRRVELDARSMGSVQCLSTAIRNMCMAAEWEWESVREWEWVSSASCHNISRSWLMIEAHSSALKAATPLA